MSANRPAACFVAGQCVPIGPYRILIAACTLAMPCVALSYTPAEEREFSDIAENGCSNRKGDFIIRGMMLLSLNV